jgi:hypothetical protein
MNKSDQINEILGSLDNCSKATAPDFFYTRLKARMEREAVQAVPQSSWIPKPVYVMAVAIAVLVLNAFILLQNNNSGSAATTPDTDTFQSLAAEYRLNDNNNLFDLTEERQP